MPVLFYLWVNPARPGSQRKIFVARPASERRPDWNEGEYQSFSQALGRNLRPEGLSYRPGTAHP